MDIVLKQAESEKEIRISRELFLEYAHSLNFDLCFQDFDKELESLPGKYALPSGRLTLCYVDGIPAGCIALRNIDDDTCEMKRLYVKPDFRGLKLGMKLSQHLLKEAKKIGYKKMRLDTIASTMKHAFNLYEQMGFYEIEPYNYNPQPGVVYMEIEL